MTMTVTRSAITILGVRLPLRIVEIDGEKLSVPRGISRNNTRKAWQIKLERDGLKLITGSISDGDMTPAESLSATIAELVRMIGEAGGIETVKSKGRGNRVQPLRLTDHITLHWKVVNTTPTAYLMVYSPQLKKPKTINIGIKGWERFHVLLAEALYYEAQVMGESMTPFEKPDFDVIDFMRPKAMELFDRMRAEIVTFCGQEEGLREKAELQRAHTLASNEMGLSLAQRAVERAKGRRA